ncbi:hypothetical protein MKX03_004220 [Papaver bracteatum]|nr:hypothetical protein MKX03_004220 [Papaver bracteatum]
MENLDSLNSILPFLPVVSSSSSYDLSWPNQIIETLKSLSEGPDVSEVNSGEILFLTISNIRNCLGRLHSFLQRGIENLKWFGEIIPALAILLLKLPSLLEAHYRDADEIHHELIGALLACSFFCLFPTVERRGKFLGRINFDCLFANLHPAYNPNQEHKIKCLIRYFERISACMPLYCVSFERKVIPMESSSFCVSYPAADFWSKSATSLCHLEYVGGGSLGRGCIQEEIRFMINPELIVGMLFLPRMDANEAIEIVGERFSYYTGYRSSFRFLGDYTDTKLIDCMGRRRTRIIAIDASAGLKEEQFRVENLVNKAWCGFFDQIKYQSYQKGHQEDDIVLEPSFSGGLHGGGNEAQLVGNCHDELGHRDSCVKDDIGIATGNWGCGDFGG